MAPPDKKAGTLPTGEERTNGSETASTSKSDIDVAHGEKAEGITPHKSRHAAFAGADQVFEPPSNMDSKELPDVDRVGTYDKRELTEDECYAELGFSFPEWKKW